MLLRPLSELLKKERVMVRVEILIRPTNAEWYADVGRRTPDVINRKEFYGGLGAI